MANLKLFFMILAAVLFAIGAFAWPAPIEPYRIRFVAAGLLSVVVSFLITA
jgi:hypothetical protein